MSPLLSEVFRVELVSAILTIGMLESVSASRSSVLIIALLALRITFALAANLPCTELWTMAAAFVALTPLIFQASTLTTARPAIQLARPAPVF